MGSQALWGQPALYNSVLPTLVDGQGAGLQVDGRGRLITSLGQVTTADAGTAPGTSLITGGVYNSTPPALTNGQANSLQLDSAANLKVNLATKLDPTNDGITTYPFGHSTTVISTATTTTAKSGAGVLDRIIVTGGTTGTIVIYDNTAASGTKLADFDTTNALAAYPFNAAFATGLTIVTSAATKLTAIWR